MSATARPAPSTAPRPTTAPQPAAAAPPAASPRPPEAPGPTRASGVCAPAAWTRGPAEGFTTPPEAPLLGHLPAFRREKLDFLARVVREHGDVVPLRFGPLRFWLVQDPVAVGDVLANQADAFQKDIGLRRAKVLLGEGLLTAEGEVHAARRAIATPAFRKASLERFVPAIGALARGAARRWAAAPGGRVDLHREMSGLALAIVGRVLFGADLVDAAPGIGDALTEALALVDRRLNATLPLPLWLPTPANVRLRRAKARLDAAVLGIIQERRRRLASAPAPRGRPADALDAPSRGEGAGPAPACGGGDGAGHEHADDDAPDLLGRLMAARRPSGAPALDDTALRDEVMTLFLAGHETTASALAFGLWLLAAHPDAARALRAEVAAHLGDRPIEAGDLAGLSYTHQVFEEALRLYPPAWMLGRECTREVEIGARPLRVQPGEVVVLSPYLLHRDARYWEDPLAFHPERFAPGAPRPLPHAYVPFGAGRRSCIGRSLALLEGVAVLATLAQEVDIEVDARAELRLEPLITLRPKGGIPARVRARARAAEA